MRKCFYLIVEGQIVGIVSKDKEKLSKLLKSIDTDITSFQEIELNTDFDNLLKQP